MAETWRIFASSERERTPRRPRTALTFRTRLRAMEAQTTPQKVACSASASAPIPHRVHGCGRHLMDNFTIRPAAVADASAIAELMETGMSVRVRRLTILGSSLLARWVASHIASESGDAFLVADVEGKVGGMLSSRVSGTTLVLNHLYIGPEFQRRGLARALVARALKSAKTETVAVDVFPESKIARRWYSDLGFKPEYERVWLETPLAAPVPRIGTIPWSTTGLEQADLIHTQHGFSNFKLTTPLAEYTVGRLSDSVFRVVGFGVLADMDALAALAALDPRRTLLCIGAPGDVPAGALRAGRIVEKSERLVAKRTRVGAKLGGKCS